MYGLNFYGEYPQVIADELESLVAAIRNVFYKEHNEDGSHIIAVPSSLVPVGAMTMWGAATAPEKWLLCDGTQVSRVTYKSLFDVIGTNYGVGDGSTTFHLPDLRQRFPLGKAAAGTGATIGGTGGAIDHTHAGGTHTHTFSGTGSAASDGAHSHGGTIGAGGDHDHGGATGAGGDHGHGYGPTFDEVQTGTGDFCLTSIAINDSGDHTHSIGSSGTHTHSASISEDGAHGHNVSVSGTTDGASGTTGTANPPYLVVNYIIHVGV